MPHSPGKFCIDRNLVRWTLINGVINRKTLQDPPAGGQDVPVRQVRAIQKTTVKKVERLPFGRTMVLLGVLLLAVAWWSMMVVVRVSLGVAGLATLYSGAERMRARISYHDAYQLVIPGRKREEWLVVGSTPEILGFIEAVQSEITDETNVAGV